MEDAEERFDYQEEEDDGQMVKEGFDYRNVPTVSGFHV